MKGLDQKVSSAGRKTLWTSRDALVDGDDFDFSCNESIAEDDTADTTLRVNVRIGGDRLWYTGDLPKL